MPLTALNGSQTVKLSSCFLNIRTTLPLSQFHGCLHNFVEETNPVGFHLTIPGRFGIHDFNASRLASEPSIFFIDRANNMIASHSIDEFRNLKRVQYSNQTESGTPTAAQIRRECERIQRRWTKREATLRRIRSEMAIRFGICRNL
jgi:hypothetical protein